MSNLHFLEGFYVITVISNVYRYKIRYELYHTFQQYIEQSGVKLLTVELAFGDREFEVTHKSNSLNVQLRTNCELWHKENLVNIGISHLPPDARYVAWIDADVQFTRPDWAIETVHQLQHHRIVQMWNNCVDLGPKHEALDTFTSFAKCFTDGLPMKATWDKDYTFPHPGFAWAARLDFLKQMGGLIDFAILGSADAHMCWALLGRVSDSFHGYIHQSYKNACLEWQKKAMKFGQFDIGVVDTSMFHFWHGKKKDRKYVERWEILVKNNFNLVTDIIKDGCGLYKLKDECISLKNDIRKYFKQRNEDSIDLN